MQKLYYIHSPADWGSDDIAGIRADLAGLEFHESKDAAIGEGIGGTGFETVVEILLDGDVAKGLVSALIFEVAKSLWNRRPSKKRLPKALPKSLDVYRLVVHVETGDYSTIVGIDLKNNPRDIETAITVRLKDRLRGRLERIEQSGDDWSVY